MRKICIVSSIVLAMSTAGYASIGEPIGVVSFVEGVADAARAGQEAIVLKEGAPVYVQDRIRTKSYSKIGITLLDKSVVKMAPGTCVTFEEFRMGENSRRELARVKLTRGKLEAVVAKTGMPETFVIDTPNSRGAVKGSDIFVSYMAGKTGVFVQEGALSLINPALPSGKTLLGKGSCVFVPLSGAPQDVRPVLDLEMSIHKKDVSRTLVKKWVPGKGAAQMSASIVSAAGSVRIYKKGAGDWQDAVQGASLEEGDLLQTAEDAKAELRLSNGNTLFVQSGTELALVTMKQDSASGDFENTFEMKRGHVTSVVEKLSKQSTFQLKTSTAVCGVRGTVLDVVAPLPTVDNPAPPTQVFFEGGSGVVTSLLTGQTQDVAPGENVSVDPSGNISPPAATSVEQRSEITGGVSGGQAADNFSGSQGAATVEAGTAALLGSQGAAAAESISAVSPLAGETQNLALLSTLTFDQVAGASTAAATGITEVYHNDQFSWNSLFTMPSGLGSATMDLKLKSDGSWTGVISGTAIGNVGSPWTIYMNNPQGDDLSFTMTGPLSISVDSVFDVTSLNSPNDQINGATSGSKTLTYVNDPGSEGSFDHGSATYEAPVKGTWVNN